VKSCDRLGDEERTVMHLVPAAAVRLMKRRVLSRPGVRSLAFKVWNVRSGKNRNSSAIFFQIIMDPSKGNPEVTIKYQIEREITVHPIFLEILTFHISNREITLSHSCFL